MNPPMPEILVCRILSLHSKHFLKKPYSQQNLQNKPNSNIKGARKRMSKKQKREILPFGRDVSNVSSL